jgi:hypothetical protein
MFKNTGQCGALFGPCPVLARLSNQKMEKSVIRCGNRPPQRGLRFGAYLLQVKGRIKKFIGIRHNSIPGRILELLLLGDAPEIEVRAKAVLVRPGLVHQVDRQTARYFAQLRLMRDLVAHKDTKVDSGGARPVVAIRVADANNLKRKIPLNFANGGRNLALIHQAAHRNGHFEHPPAQV